MARHGQESVKDRKSRQKIGKFFNKEGAPRGMNPQARALAELPVCSCRRGLISERERPHSYVAWFREDEECRFRDRR